MKKTKEKKPGKTGEKISLPESPRKVNKVTIENHMQAAAHHNEAAKYHLEAARHYEGGNSERAAYFAMLAHGHHTLAGQFINDDAKHHVQELKITNFHNK